MSERKQGRPSNKQLIADGKLVVSTTCKICQSSVRDEITRAILNKEPSSVIIEKYGGYFTSKLTPTNIHSHKQHISPEAAVQVDREKALLAVAEYDPVTKALYKQKYAETFDKAKASDELYKQRLQNLFYLQTEIQQYNELERRDGILDPSSQALRRKLITELEIAYRGFNQDLLKHIQLDADLYEKQVNIQYIATIHKAFLSFTQKFMDILVKEINDNGIRERVVEQLGDLLDKEVAPNLDPNKALDASYEVLDETESEEDKENKQTES